MKAPAPQLGFVASLAVADAIDATCGWKRTRLKWPNDILLDGKKAAGILLEVEPTPLGDAVVVGIGLNLQHFPTDADYPATSLKSYGVETTPETALTAILRALEDRLSQRRDQGFDETLRHWSTRGHRLGERLRVGTISRQHSATFVGLDSDGSLLAQIDDEVRRFTAADILSN